MVISDEFTAHLKKKKFILKEIKKDLYKKRGQGSGGLVLLEAGRDTVEWEGRQRAWGIDWWKMRERLSYCFCFLNKF